MKKSRLLCILIIIMFACNTQDKALKKERIKWGYNKWKENFKDYVLCNCLIKGYGNKDIYTEMRFNDRSFSSPVNYSIFDSAANIIVKPLILQMKADSVKGIGKISENGLGKNVFKTCIEFYKSKKLDSLTNLESKKWIEIESIDSLIAKKVSAF